MVKLSDEFVIDVFPTVLAHETKKVYIGGETHALEHLQKRLNVELTAFVSNSFLPNRRNPELLRPPKSLSTCSLHVITKPEFPIFRLLIVFFYKNDGYVAIL